MISHEQMETRLLALENQVAGILYALTQPINTDGTAEAVSPFSANHVMKVFGTEEEESKTERK